MSINYLNLKSLILNRGNIMTVAFNNKLVITQRNNRFYINNKLVLTSIGKILKTQKWDYVHPSLK